MKSHKTQLTSSMPLPNLGSKSDLYKKTNKYSMSPCQHCSTRSPTYVSKPSSLYRLSTEQSFSGYGKNTRRFLDTIKKHHFWMPLVSGKKNGQLDLAKLVL